MKPGVSSLTGEGGFVRRRKIISGVSVFVFWFLLLEPAMFPSYYYPFGEISFTSRKSVESQGQFF